jgi:tetratricopeptide (TPR) repeat protein
MKEINSYRKENIQKQQIFIPLRWVIIMNSLNFKELEPQNSKVLYKRAESYFFDKNYLFSLKDLISLVDIDKNNIEAYILMGRIHLSTGKFSQSVEDYNDALKINPGNKEALEKLQTAQTAVSLNEKLEKLLETKQFKEAIEVLGFIFFFSHCRCFNHKICKKPS